MKKEEIASIKLKDFELIKTDDCEKSPMHKDLRNLIKINSFYNFLSGFVEPFIVIFFNEFGSLEEVGISLSLIIIFEGLVSLFTSKYLHKLGIKRIILITQIFESLRVLGFIFAQNVYHVYLLQILGGLFKGFNTPAYTNLFVDVCKDESSKSIGKYSSLTTIVYGISVLIGGFMIGFFGYKIMFMVWALQELFYGFYVYSKV
ncbi:MAG: MFS transporter [Candidatus Nanoarchaeia archaeon]